MRMRLLVFVLLLFLMLSVGSVMAQSSASYSVTRWVALGAGQSSSASYSVTTVVGQPASGIVVSPDYRGTIGFLYPPASDPGSALRLPLIIR